MQEDKFYISGPPYDVKRGLISIEISGGLRFGQKIKYKNIIGAPTGPLNPPTTFLQPPGVILQLLAPLSPCPLGFPQVQ